MNPNIFRTKVISAASFALALAAFGGPLCAQQQKPPRYTVIDLAPNAAFSEALDVDNNGLIVGVASAPDGTSHAALWYKGMFTDIGAPGLGGPASNSEAFTANERGQVVGQAETLTADPHSENFCGYGTGFECRPFLWQNGKMTALPLPLWGGHNGQAISINSHGQVAGLAEFGTVDATCPSPQILDYGAVIWSPESGEIQELSPLSGDSVTVALWINDKGQAIGQSGSCANSLRPPLAVGPHAVLWENNSPIDLGNLGGKCLNPCFSPLLGPLGNTALFISNQGHIVGASVLPGEQTIHAFLWTKETGKMQDLQTIPGDIGSVALSINEKEEVVGLSFDATGSPRAFLRYNGQMTDLNTLIVGDSPFLVLLGAEIINSSGEIAGFGLTTAFEVHAFLATPASSEDTNELADLVAPVAAKHANIVLPESIRKQLRKRMWGRYHIGAAQ